MPRGLNFGVPLVLEKGTKDQFCQQLEDPKLRLRHARNRKWIFRGYSNHIDGPLGGWAQYERWGDYYSLDYSSCLKEIQDTMADSFGFAREIKLNRFLEFRTWIIIKLSTNSVTASSHFPPFNTITHSHKNTNVWSHSVQECPLEGWLTKRGGDVS